MGTKEYIKNTQQRYKYYWIFQENLGNGRKNVLYKILNKLKYATVFKVDRRKRNEDVFKYYYSGAQWFSITHDFARYVVSKEKQIRRVFNKTICCDEVFLQTILMNSAFKENLYHKESDGDYVAIMRMLDWDRGTPYTWLKKDYEELINSEFLFARKFSETIDSEIIDKIFKKLYNNWFTF